MMRRSRFSFDTGPSKESKNYVIDWKPAFEMGIWLYDRTLLEALHEKLADPDADVSLINRWIREDYRQRFDGYIKLVDYSIPYSDTHHSDQSQDPDMKSPKRESLVAGRNKEVVRTDSTKKKKRLSFSRGQDSRTSSPSEPARIEAWNELWQVDYATIQDLMQKDYHSKGPWIQHQAISVRKRTIDDRISVPEEELRAIFQSRAEAWTKSGACELLCKTLLDGIGRFKTIRKIIAFGLGSLDKITDEANPSTSQAIVDRHAALIIIARTLEEIYITVDPKTKPIEILVHDPDYSAEARSVLTASGFKPVTGPQAFAEIDVDLHTFVYWHDSPFTQDIPVAQIIADMPLPGAILCLPPTLARNRHSHSERSVFMLEHFERTKLAGGFDARLSWNEVHSWVEGNGKERMTEEQYERERNGNAEFLESFGMVELHRRLKWS